MRSLDRARGLGYLPVVGVVCCQVCISETGRSFIRRSPTECGVSGCDREFSMIRRSWLSNDYCAMRKKINPLAPEFSFKF
jgi:hypothetical protein